MEKPWNDLAVICLSDFNTSHLKIIPLLTFKSHVGYYKDQSLDPQCLLYVYVYVYVICL